MRKRSSKEQRDLNKLAFSIIDEATAEIIRNSPGKNPAAVALGRRGGLKGGKARAAMLSSQQRSNIAKNAAIARWSKK
jgi:hypothetical protein